MSKMLIDKVSEYFASKMIEDAVDSRVGVELEFPISKLDGSIIDLKIIKNLTKFIVKKLGFVSMETDNDGMPIKMQHPQTKDVISFEYCYAILEFSMAPAISLVEIDKTFQMYFRNIQHYLAKHDHHLICMGTNPYRWIKKIPILKTDFHHIASDHLQKTKMVPSAIASSHTHLSLTAKDFIDALNVVNKSEWIKTKLFYNSCLFDDKINHSSLIRDSFWKNSGFILGRDRFPSSNRNFKDLKEYYDFFAKTTPVLFVKRNGKYIAIDKMSVARYFNSDFVIGRVVENQTKSNKVIKIQPDFDDIQYFKSYFYNRVTHFGTLEIRSACQQPIGSLFTPTAFNLGLVYNRVAINKFLRKTNHMAFVGKASSEFLLKFCDLIRDGLIMRGFDEEKYLECLYDRVLTNINPAKRSVYFLKSKNYSLNEVVRQFSNLEI